MDNNEIRDIIFGVMRQNTHENIIPDEIKFSKLLRIYSFFNAKFNIGYDSIIIRPEFNSGGILFKTESFELKDNEIETFKSLILDVDSFAVELNENGLTISVSIQNFFQNNK